MWIFTVGGVYSVVKQKDGYAIRCRLNSEYEHLKKLLSDDDTASYMEDFSNQRDYKFRAIVKSLDIFMKSVQDEITYNNFKHHLSLVRPQSQSLNDLYLYVYSANLMHSKYPEMFTAVN